MKKLLDLIKKSWWVPKKQATQIKDEAKKNWGENESALMRHIITNWFKK